MASAVWFRAPERASRIASWARSRRHGEEWLCVFSDVKAWVRVRVCCFRVRVGVWADTCSRSGPADPEI